MKTSQTTHKVMAAIAGMVLFLGAAAAAGIDRSQDLAGNGIETTVSKSFGGYRSPPNQYADPSVEVIEADHVVVYQLALDLVGELVAFQKFGQLAGQVLFRRLVRVV